MIRNDNLVDFSASGNSDTSDIIDIVGKNCDGLLNDLLESNSFKDCINPINSQNEERLSQLTEERNILLQTIRGEYLNMMK